jgi:hypothetical protein
MKKGFVEILKETINRSWGGSGTAYFHPCPDIPFIVIAPRYKVEK